MTKVGAGNLVAGFVLALGAASSPSFLVAQHPDVTAAVQLGYDRPWSGDDNLVTHQGGESIEAQVALQWPAGFELGVGATLTFGEERPPAIDLATPGGSPSVFTEQEGGGALFERLEYWTLYLEPRYRFRASSTRLQPFLGARVGWVRQKRDFGKEDGFSGGASAGIDYWVTRAIALTATGTLEVMTLSEFGRRRWTDGRGSVRGGLRVRL